MAVDIDRNVLPVDEIPAESSIKKWIADSGCSRLMTPSVDVEVNYHESGGA